MIWPAPTTIFQLTSDIQLIDKKIAKDPKEPKFNPEPILTNVVKLKFENYISLYICLEGVEIYKYRVMW